MVIDVTDRTTQPGDPDISNPAAAAHAAVPRRMTARIRRRPKRISWRDVITPTGWAKVIILAALLGLLYRNQVYRIVYAWIHDPNWSHGFLIPLFSLYFLHQRREKLLQVRHTAGWTDWLGLGLVVLCILGCLASIYPLRMGYPQLLALLGTLFGIIWLCCGWRVTVITWLPTLYLFFALPLPKRLYEYLTLPLRKLASEASVMVLSLIPDLDVEAHGVIIEGLYQGTPFQLSVAEACAGMRLMMAFVALGVAMAYLSDRRYWHRIILLITTVPIAIFCNVVRVTATGVIYVLIDPQFATGSFHTALGLLMLPVAFGLYWLVAFVLNNLYVEEPLPERANR